MGAGGTHCASMWTWVWVPSSHIKHQCYLGEVERRALGAY